MHTQDARAEGESEQRLSLIAAWREAPFCSERERAALAWTEAITLVANDHVPDEVYWLPMTTFPTRCTSASAPTSPTRNW